jgi:hypothetical protein
MSQHEPAAQQNAMPRDVAGVVARINADYATLTATLDGWTEAQQTGPTDAQGWTVKDHITHLAAWEQSMVSLFNGRPRHEGLGVSAALYQSEDIDAINAAIREKHKDVSLAEAHTLLADAHRQMLAVLDTLTFDDLFEPYSHFLPDEPGDDDGSPIIGRLRGNTFGHYAEHLPWMTAIAE